MFAAPPPPIAQSVMLQAPDPYGTRRAGSRGTSREDGARGGQGFGRTTAVGSGAVDPLLVLERRERAIQRDLQALLDAQSEGLIQGFGGSGSGGLDEGSEAGSNTPTSHSINGTYTSRRGSGSQSRSSIGGIVPVRQPKSKRLGLRGARRGLLREMGELADVKAEEGTLLEREIARRRQLLRKIETWEKRITTAKQQLSSAPSATNSTSAEDERGIADLQQEEANIDAEIQELQDRLATLQARKSWVSERIKERVNKREARLSSYRGVLREAEAEVKSFLLHPPATASSIVGEQETFASLPPGRRTLGLAKECWGKEHDILSSRLISVAKEHAALEEGVVLWGECVATISTFETELRAKMSSGREVTEGDLRAQISRMGEVIKDLELVRARAEGEGWNLLLVAVGAEVEAFHMGRGILRDALGISDEEGQAGNAAVTAQVDDKRDGSEHVHKSAVIDKQRDGAAADGVDDRGNEDDQLVLNSLEDELGLPRHEGKSHTVGKVDTSEDDDDEDDGPNLDELLVDNRVD